MVWTYQTWAGSVEKPSWSVKTWILQLAPNRQSGMKWRNIDGLINLRDLPFILESNSPFYTYAWACNELKSKIVITKNIRLGTQMEP